MRCRMANAKLRMGWSQRSFWLDDDVKVENAAESNRASVSLTASVMISR